MVFVGRMGEFNDAVQRSVEVQDKLKTLSLRLTRELKSLKRDSKRLAEDLNDAAVVKDLGGAIHTLERRCTKLRDTQPETRSLFNRIMLGRVNVKCFSERERIRLRDEYNKFKLRTNVLFVLFPCCVLFFHYYLRHEWEDTHWINVFHHLWLLYYFVSLALRENILLVNGSNIRPWWIYHHYLSAAGTVVWLVWPPTPIYTDYVPYVTSLCLYTGLVQAVQIMFYKRRDYVNRALGKTGHMDVSYPETLTELPKELLLLIPLWFIAHLWQLSLGISFFRTLFSDVNPFDKHWTQWREELQVGFAGLFSVVLGGGNFINVIVTIYSKVTKIQQTKLQKEEREQLERVLQLYEKPKDN